ncbi:MAG: DUF302 domain-containing protein [Pseudomonadales bacterium]|nr:DUF302 domain-containing protein [Pseudomonadales bacterium]
MKILPAFVLFSLMTASLTTFAADGLMTVKSPHSVQATMDAVEQLVKQRGLTVFARIDHAAGAAGAGMTLRPTQLLIFGNPQGGTPFMQCAQTVGIELPLKVLVWQDESGQVWLGYNDPAFLASRHEAGECPIVANMNQGLKGIAAAAVAP